MTSQKKLCRYNLELMDGEFVPASQIKTSAQAKSALAVVKMQVKDALWGLSPMFTKEVLLAICMEVMAEDDDASGPQTKIYSDHFSEMGA